MVGSVQRVVCIVLVIGFITAGVPVGWSATDSGTAAYREGEVLLVDTTWTGTVWREKTVVVPPGRTLTIDRATVGFNTTTTRHLGIFVEVGGTLLVRDSTLQANATGIPELDRARRYWEFTSHGVVQIERSVVMHAGDIALEMDGTRGSFIRDSQLLWLSRGIHVLRTNLTDAPGWDLELENVLIQDMPVITGSGTPDIGGAIGILNGDVLIRNVTIERARTTAVFVDRSAVSKETEGFGNRVEAYGLTVVAGVPAGFTGQGTMLYVRTTGAFLCEGCAFIAPARNGGMLLSDGHDIQLRDVTIVEGELAMSLPADARVRFDGVRFVGETAAMRYRYANQAHPELSRVSFTSPTGRPAVVAERDIVQAMPDVYWGDPTGPRDTAPFDLSVPPENQGLGRVVVGSIDYSGWAAQPAPPAGLAVVLGDVPSAVAPGAPLEVAYAVTNVGDSVADVTLRPLAVLPATLSSASAQLAPGEALEGTLSLEVPPGVAADTVVAGTLLAIADGTRAAASFSTRVGTTRPILAIDEPLPAQTVSGALRVAGRVREPMGPSAPQSAGGPPDANGDDVDDRVQLSSGDADVIVRHDGEDEAGVRAAIEAAGGRVIRAFELSPIVWALVPANALPDLAALPHVRDVWWDEPVEEQLAVGVRAARARSSLEGMLPGGVAPDAPYEGVWSGNPVDGYQGATGRGQLIAVIDTGIDGTHASLDDMDDDATTNDPKIAARISTFTVLATEDSDVSLSSVVFPGKHGTWVAGAAAGTGAQFVGTRDAPVHGTTADDPWARAGAAPGARIIDIDAYEDTGDVSSSIPPVGFGAGTLAPNAGFGLALQGFEAVASWNRAHPDEPIRIVQISLALGSTDVDHPFNEMADALAETGVLIVVAVGNDHSGAVVPATARKVLAVGATRIGTTVDRGDDGRASFSDVSNDAQRAAGVLKPELMAPGSKLYLPEQNGIDAYTQREGTSFAAPIVSGIAALVLEANPELHPAQVKEILIRSAQSGGDSSGARYTDVDLDFEDDLADGGWTPEWGYGYVDGEEAVRLARESEPGAPPAPPSLVLHASGDALDPTEPAEDDAAPGEGSWSYSPASDLVLGDGDAGTAETLLLLVNAPSTTPGATTTQAIASLYADDVLVSRFKMTDDTISTAVPDERLRLTMLLGKDAEVTYRGPDTGRIMELADLGVLDARGSVTVPAGGILRLDIKVNHTGGGPAPILTGPEGTQILLPLDPVSLPNGGPPGPVIGTGATWDATRATIVWGPAPDDRGVGGYEVLRDGIPIASLSGRTYQYTDGTLAPLQKHTYRVRAVDIHGLLGVPGPAVVVTTPPPVGRAVVVDVTGVSELATDDGGDLRYHAWHADIEPAKLGRHTLRATLYEDGVALDEERVVVDMRAVVDHAPVVTLPPIGIVRGARGIAIGVDDAEGPEDVVSVEWRVDGGEWRPAVGGLAAIDARALDPGSHTLEARATDAAGESGAASASFVAQPWRATLDVPGVLELAAPALVRVTLEGEGIADAQPRLVGSGAASFDEALAPVGDGAFETTIAPLATGYLSLRVRAGADLLGETTVVVDRPPTARIVAPVTSGSRLDTLHLTDASLDDGGIAAREWTLPDGSTSSERVLALPLAGLAVGEHRVHLRATNVNGLDAYTSIAIDVIDLAPRITVSSFTVEGVDGLVTNAYTGERVRLRVEIVDPEGDPLEIAGGLVVDGASQALAPGVNDLLVRPQEASAIALDVTASDAWRSTRATTSLPVVTNQPPVASITLPGTVKADVGVHLDSRVSRDPDRGVLVRDLTVEGLGSWSASRQLVVFPLGTWNVTYTATDSSGASATVQRVVASDDWLAPLSAWAVRPSLLEEGVANVSVRWFDGAPAAGARVNVTVRHEALGAPRWIEATAGADGRVLVPIGLDTAFLNLPGAHTIEVTASHASRPEAPIQDVETGSWSERFSVA